MQVMLSLEVSLIAKLLEEKIYSQKELYDMLKGFDETSLMVLSEEIENYVDEEKYLLVDNLIDQILIDNYEYLIKKYNLTEESINFIDYLFICNNSINLDVEVFADEIKILNKKEIIALLELAYLKGNTSFYTDILKADDLNNLNLTLQFIKEVDRNIENNNIEENYLFYYNYSYADCMIILKYLYKKFQNPSIIYVNEIIKIIICHALTPDYDKYVEEYSFYEQKYMIISEEPKKRIHTK